MIGFFSMELQVLSWRTIYSFRTLRDAGPWARSDRSYRWCTNQWSI